MPNDLPTTNLNEDTSSVFEFIKLPEKLRALTLLNNKLNINKHNHNTIVFVYSSPKVGSTSIVSSLRLFGNDKLDIIHIHDEEMLSVLTNVTGVTVNELILFNKHIGKNVYVINVFRSPIERKISAFFEKIGSYHFNNSDQHINTYNITKVINRFNNIFPWIGNGDHFVERYNINIPLHFDVDKKYSVINSNGIQYLTLRLKDSNEWGNILTHIFGFPIRTIKDYESSNKPIKDLYKQFKATYRIPINLLNDIKNDKFLNYYYSEYDVKSYYDEWLKKSTSIRESYNYDQYKLYEQITIENSHMDTIQSDHYFDEGCSCKACNIKRFETVSKIMRGIEVTERIVHNDAKTELIQKRVINANKINKMVQTLPNKTRCKDFKRDMTSVVSHNTNRFYY